MRCLKNICALFLVVLSSTNGIDEFRLPGASIPLNYDLALVTNVHNGTRRFDGVVKIDIQVTESSSTLTLHLQDLVIDGKIKVLDNGNVDIFDSYSTEAEKHFLHLHTLRPLIPAENLTTEIAYHGNLQTNMAGFYLSSYIAGGKTR